MEKKNTLEGTNRRLDGAEERISTLEDRLGYITQSEQQEEKRNQKMRIV